MDGIIALGAAKAAIKVVDAKVDALPNTGRFLSLWNASTGLPVTAPGTTPFTYLTGDYYRVSVVASGSGTNYKPSGSTYTGAASTTVESGAVTIGWLYYYDGTQWVAKAEGVADAGSINYDSTASYSSGTVGNALTSQSAQITNLSTNKADKTALALTDKKLQYLSDLTKGKVWTEEAGTTPAYQHTVESGAKAVAINGVGGKTIVYNQLCNPSTYGGTKSISGVTFTYNNDGTYTASGTATGIGVANIATGYHLTPNHTYFVSAPQSNSAPSMQIFNATSSSNLGNVTYGGKLITFSDSATDSITVRFIVYSGTSYSGTEIPLIFDLTAMGATSTDTDTVDHAKAFLLTQGIDVSVYNAYNAGELVSADVTSVVSKDEDDVTLGTFAIPQNGAHSTFKTAYPMRSAGSVNPVCDYIDIENKLYKPRTASRAYQSGDESDTSVTTDGTTTYYASTGTDVDISSYFTDDNLLTVEGNGTLTFVQSDTTKNIYVPNDTVYAVQLSDAT